MLAGWLACWLGGGGLSISQEGGGKGWAGAIGSWPNQTGLSPTKWGLAQPAGKITNKQKHEYDIAICRLGKSLYSNMPQAKFPEDSVDFGSAKARVFDNSFYERNACTKKRRSSMASLLFSYSFTHLRRFVTCLTFSILLVAKLFQFSVEHKFATRWTLRALIGVFFSLLLMIILFLFYYASSSSSYS